MKELLDASCVFNCLLEKYNILQLVEGKSWKNTSPLQCKPYRCSFFYKKYNHNCIVSFQIIICENNRHCVKLESVESLLDGINAEDAEHIDWVLSHCLCNM